MMMNNKINKKLVKLLLVAILISNIVPSVVSKIEVDSVKKNIHLSLFAETVKDIKSIENKSKNESINIAKEEKQNQLFKVMLVILLAWLGISFLLVKIYLKVQKLEKELEIE